MTACPLIISVAVDDKPDEKAPQFATIRILYKIIQQHISKARENLVYASINAPMYGVLQSIRPALKEAISRYVYYIVAIIITTMYMSGSLGV